jgi:tetratricopeptide (TPR) repeat protein
VETKDLELEKSAGEVERLSNSPELKAQCHALMINYFVDINDHEKVLEEYEKLHRIDPTLKILINSPSGSRSAAWVCKKVALVHQVAGNFEESLKFSNRAMELTPPSWSHPMDCRLILERAEAYAHMGRLNEARIDARLWKSKNPPPPVTSNDYDDYSMMHTLLGNRKKAYQYMEKAISMAPGNYRLIGNRGVIRSILGEGEASRADFKYFMSRATPQEKRVAEKVAKNLGINISD